MPHQLRTNVFAQYTLFNEADTVDIVVFDCLSGNVIVKDYIANLATAEFQP